jgi:exodeoxyribonuclease V
LAIVLSPDQEEAVAKAQAWFGNWTHQPIFRLFGYAGTGKTTTLKVLLASLGITSSQVACVAPSGKAAKVMSGSLGMVATTIHKRFYKMISSPEQYWRQLTNERSSLEFRILVDDASTKELDLWKARIAEINEEMNDKSKDIEPEFKFQGAGALDHRVRLVLIDEASMVTNDILGDLEGLCLPIILVGDPGQLPPVQKGGEAKQPCRAMQDPDVELTQIHRQEGESSIIDIANLVREGMNLETGDDGRGVSVRDGTKYGAKFELCLRKARISEDEFLSFAMGDDSQIICGRNHTRRLINDFVRQRLGLTGMLPTGNENEKIIVTQNFENEDIYIPNGSFIGVRPTGQTGTIKIGREIESIDLPTKIFKLDDDPIEEFSASIWKNPYVDPHESNPERRRIESSWAKKTIKSEWGWAITCHKAQGSQWKRVLVFDESSAFQEDRAKWLYTAVTRAKEELTVIKV